MPEDYPFVSYEKVAPILEALGGRRAARIEGKDLGGDEGAIEAVSEGEATSGSGYQPESVDGLSATNGDHPNRDDANQNNNGP